MFVSVTHTDTNFGHKQYQCGHASTQKCNFYLGKGTKSPRTKITLMRELSRDLKYTGLFGLVSSLGSYAC